MPELPGGTLTMLHTDVEQSTLLTVHLGDRYPEVLATHRSVVRAAFAALEGHEVDTQGDSFFVAAGEIYERLAAYKDATESPSLEEVLSALRGRRRA